MKKLSLESVCGEDCLGFHVADSALEVKCSTVAEFFTDVWFVSFLPTAPVKLFTRNCPPCSFTSDSSRLVSSPSSRRW